jgi:hypothetical protein
MGGFIGKKRVRGTAARRLSRGECHGMQVRLDFETLYYSAALDALERLAAFLGVGEQIIRGEDELSYRADLASAILREEKRLAACPRAERWDTSPNRRRWIRARVIDGE